ncbi:hypothetical protein [Rathayibacter sp. VKM Ac-2760]|uniref:hypothetical protein n=1 Tax=Rathayibacter sp. VKM Ac-2760 TaxID=2609253 RepID=UPI001317EB01|nr:hypothetical protein [Rathayibacter sp. VKM Ac-2760]QHC59713.1 hypothetical protein GSU72_15000 [Rathayibacter sp. VKM Ac-2760]
MRRTAASPAAALVGAITALLLAGCAPAAATRLPEGVSVAVQQNRDDYGPRRIEVLVTNDSAAPLEVARASLESSAFTGAAESSRATTVRPGTTTALRLQLAPPDCADAEGDGTDAADGTAADAAAAAASVRLDFTQGDASGSAVVTPDDPLGSLPRIHAEDCLAQRVAGIVSIEPGDSVSVAEEGGEAVAHLGVVLTPTGAPGSVSIASIGRTILLRPASGADSWPVGARLDAGAAPVRFDLPILPSNCNTHTVSEDKRGTFLPVAVALEDGTTGVVAVGVSDAVRGELYRFIAEDSCHWE